jgi:viroplasmin and RNaseH domain-containing protein
VIGFPNARFKKFETQEEAEQFIHPEPELVTKNVLTKRMRQTIMSIPMEGVPTMANGMLLLQ